MDILQEEKQYYKFWEIEYLNNQREKTKTFICMLLHPWYDAHLHLYGCMNTEFWEERIPRWQVPLMDKNTSFPGQRRLHRYQQAVQSKRRAAIHWYRLCWGSGVQITHSWNVPPLTGSSLVLCTQRPFSSLDLPERNLIQTLPFT